MNSETILQSLKKGALTMNKMPCSLCRSSNFKLPRKHFHGSDWGRCIRAVYFECLTGRKAVESPEDAQRLDDGHLHEGRLIETLKAAGHQITFRDTIDGEVIIEDTVMISLPPRPMLFKVMTIGHTDGVIDGQAVIECKAVKDWAWKHKFMRRIIPRQYYGQVQFYLHAHNFEKAFLIVKNRHSSDIMVFDILYDEAFVARKRMELAGIVSAIMESQVIAIPKQAPDDECKFCDFYNHCWEFGK